MKLNRALLASLAFAVSAIHAKVIEIKDYDYSITRAPQEIVDITERAANKIGFTRGYEVAIPTKAAIQLNPWNKFVTYVINPTTKNPLIIINPEWFSQIPAEQQDYLIGRYFLMFEQGPMPLSANIVGYLFILISLLLMIALFWLLGKTTLAQPIWLRVIVVLATIVVAEKLMLDKVEIRIKQHFINKHAYLINEMAVQKLGDRDAAIKALEHFDTSMQAELRNGMLAFAPFEKTFQKYIQELKK